MSIGHFRWLKHKPLNFLFYCLYKYVKKFNKTMYRTGIV